MQSRTRVSRHPSACPGWQGLCPCAPVRSSVPGVACRGLLRLPLVVLALQSGCVAVAPPAPSPAVRASLGAVAIVPAQYIPDSNFITFAKGKGAGAAKGAAIEGGTTAAIFAIGAAAAGPAMPFIVLAGVLQTAAMTAVGAVAGAQQAVPAEAATEVESVINAAVAGLDAQNAFAGQLAMLVQAEPWIHLAAGGVAGPVTAAARPDYSRLRTAGIDTVLEVAITGIGFESCGPEFLRERSGGCIEDPTRQRVDLFMSAQARLVRVSDGAELFVRQFRYKSPGREIPRWIAADGRLLADEFEQAYHELAERVNDEVLLVTQLDLAAPSSVWAFPGPGNPLYGICWLAPVYPKAEAVKWSERFVFPSAQPADVCPASLLHFPDIDSVRPTLRWGAFPRDLDRRQLTPTVVKNITDVTYDLKIWEAEGCERGRLIYATSGLRTPEHQMAESLAPESRYFWTVRARFVADGQPMATRWAHADVMTCFPNDISDWQYHRFVTPP